jgi:hypothetical protein
MALKDLIWLTCCRYSATAGGNWIRNDHSRAYIIISINPYQIEFALLLPRLLRSILL